MPQNRRVLLSSANKLLLRLIFTKKIKDSVSHLRCQGVFIFLKDAEIWRGWSSLNVSLHPYSNTASSGINKPLQKNPLNCITPTMYVCVVMVLLWFMYCSLYPYWVFFLTRAGFKIILQCFGMYLCMKCSWSWIKINHLPCNESLLLLLGALWVPLYSDPSCTKALFRAYCTLLLYYSLMYKE